MQISPADLGSMLRVDAFSLALGMLLLVAGLLTLVLWAGTRRRAVSLPVDHASGGAWLGIFAFLYGLRLLARTSTFRLCFDIDPSAWDYAAAAITYTIPLPIILFARAFVPGWRRFWSLGAVGMTAFAIYAIASDAILRRPESASNAQQSHRNHLPRLLARRGSFVLASRPHASFALCGSARCSRR